jgi:hypothetical protein
MFHGSGWKKKRIVVAFSIHTLQLSSFIEHPFLIEWHRGSETGMTERGLLNERNELVFEKRFRCNCSVLTNLQNSAIKPKHIKFFLVRCPQASERRVFGKLVLNLASFGVGQPPVTSMFQFETPYHQIKSFVLVSLKIIPPHFTSIVSSVLTDLDVSKLSDPQTISGDTDEEWDFSTDPQHPPLLTSLSRSTALPLSKSTRSRTFSSLSVDSGKNDRLSVFLNVPHHRKCRVSGQGSVNFLKSVLSHPWPTAPGFVIFAALRCSGLFEAKTNDQMFQKLFSVFQDNFQRRKFIENATDIEIGFACVDVLALFAFDADDLISERVSVVKEFLIQILCDTITNFNVQNFQNFEQIVDDIISLKLDLETGITSFFQLISNLGLPDFYLRQFVRHIDSQLVGRLLKHPQLCSFSNAISWSSFTTRARDQLRVDLSAFRDAANLLQMSHKICADPHAIQEVCPHLPPDVVLSLLLAQQPDEYGSPVATANFIDVFAIEHPARGFEVDWREAIDQEIAGMDVSGWRGQALDPQTVRLFPFLEDYFCS